MTTRTYTVAFEVQIEPGKGGPCHFCQDLYGPEKATAIADIYGDTGVPMFTVRNQDGATTLYSCGRHLETITVMWDTIMHELERTR